MTGPFWQMYSSDGIYWNVYPDQVDTPQCDTQNVPFWDDRLGKYVGYGRTRNPYMGFRVRGIGRIESSDFHDWSEMVEVYRAEASEWRSTPPAECAERLGGYVDVYTNAACKYPYAEDVYLMLPSFLYHWECVEVVRARVTRRATCTSTSRTPLTSGCSPAATGFPGVRPPAAGRSCGSG